MYIRNAHCIIQAARTRFSCNNFRYTAIAAWHRKLHCIAIDDLVSNRKRLTFIQAFVQYCLSKNLATSAIIRLLRAGVDRGSTAVDNV